MGIHCIYVSFMAVAVQTLNVMLLRLIYRYMTGFESPA